MVRTPRRSRHRTGSFVYHIRFWGRIVGESRSQTAWRVIKDGTERAQTVHKSFCQPELKKTK